jgi:hypothetical protein
MNVIITFQKHLYPQLSRANHINSLLQLRHSISLFTMIMAAATRVSHQLPHIRTFSEPERTGTCNLMADHISKFGFTGSLTSLTFSTSPDVNLFFL